MSLLRERLDVRELPSIGTPGRNGDLVAVSPDNTAGSWIRPGRTLLVASTGGHLEQLYRLRQRFTPQLDAVEWATFDTTQSRHLLAGEIVHYIPFVKPKDAKGTLLDSVAAAQLLGHHQYSRVISTGAAVAVPFLGCARAMGLAAHYIESAARSEGLSLSGAMVSRIPGVRLYGQYPGWTSGRYQFRGSVFDGFVPGAPRSPRTLDKVVVTFGTQRGFGFRRAAKALARLLPQVCGTSPTVLWQTGATDVSGLGVPGVESVPASDLQQAVGEADLVISHSGVGTALQTLEHGKCPVLLPRRKEFGEHTDNHQRLVAEELRRRGLAVWADPDALTVTDLIQAQGMTAESILQPPRFFLQPD